MNICLKCAHLKKAGTDLSKWICGHPNLGINPLDGSQILVACASARSSQSKFCGPNGDLWELKQHSGTVAVFPKADGYPPKDE